MDSYCCASQQICFCPGGDTKRPEKKGKETDDTPTVESLVLEDVPQPLALLDKYETDETRQLNDSQLRRLILLKQLKVLTLQQERLEAIDAQTPKDVVFDFVGFNDSNAM